MPTITKTSRLPLLKELPLDPSTLCKLTCSFVILRKHHASIDAGDRLCKTALRLLTSRSGRLLRECPMHDLVRLCDAVATSGMSIAGRERISNFVRRFVHYLNDLPSSDSDASFPLSSQHIVSLVWSLGELGVRYNPDKEQSATAYRRLQLVAEIPCLSKSQLQQFSDEMLSKMVRLREGVVASHILQIMFITHTIFSFPTSAVIRYGFDSHGSI